MDITPSQLLARPEVRSAVQNSITYGLDRMAAYVAEHPETVGPLAQSFLTTLFPYLQQQRSIAPEKHPINASVKFWDETSTLTAYKLGSLEHRVLSMETEAACILLQKIETTLMAYDKPVPVTTVIMPLREAIRKQEFHYRSLDQLK